MGQTEGLGQLSLGGRRFAALHRSSSLEHRVGPLQTHAGVGLSRAFFRPS